MATHETSIPSDPTQERFAEAVLFVDRMLSVAVDRCLLIVDFHLEKVRQLEQAKRGRK
jgi:hypothetical protein